MGVAPASPIDARPVRLDSGAWGYRTAGGGRVGERAVLAVRSRRGRRWSVEAVCISVGRSGTAVWRYSPPRT